MYVSYGAIIVENTKLANPDISFYQATMYIEKHLLSPMYKVVKNVTREVECKLFLILYYWGNNRYSYR